MAPPDLISGRGEMLRALPSGTPATTGLNWTPSSPPHSTFATYPISGELTGDDEMPTNRRQRILAELSSGPGAGSSARLCEVSRDSLGVTGAGVMLMSGEVSAGSVCSSDDVSALIEDLQYMLGEGPCIDAYHHDQVVLEPDLANPQVPRWPAFSAEAVGAGVRSVFGFPMRVGAVRLGALNFYRDQVGPLSAEQHADAMVMAEVAAQWVLDAQATAEEGVLSERSRGGCRLPFHRAERGGGAVGPTRGQRDRGAHPAACLRLQP